MEKYNLTFKGLKWRNTAFLSCLLFPNYLQAPEMNNKVERFFCFDNDSSSKTVISIFHWRLHYRKLVTTKQMSPRSIINQSIGPLWCSQSSHLKQAPYKILKRRSYSFYTIVIPSFFPSYKSYNPILET